VITLRRNDGTELTLPADLEHLFERVWEAAESLRGMNINSITTVQVLMALTIKETLDVILDVINEQMPGFTRLPTDGGDDANHSEQE
jgi:hypothetical protein